MRAKPILFDYLNCSPRNVADNRGLDLAILSGGYAEFLAEYWVRKAEAEAFGVTLGIALNSPWGRGPSTELPNGEFTGYRLDQRIQAEADGFDLTDDLITNTVPDETFIYVGSVPVGTFHEAGLSHFVGEGYRFGIDALTVHDEGGDMFSEALAVEDGRFLDVCAEANASYKGLPLIGFKGFWESESRVALEDAPENSVWWWRTEGNDGAWEPDTASRAMSYGLRPWVRLNQLTEAERFDLYRRAAPYEAVAEPPKGRFNTGFGGAWIPRVRR